MTFPTTLASNGSLYIQVNNVATTLNGGISAGAVSATLASSTLLPPVGYVTIETEAILYGANNTATSVISSLTRGADGTTAAAHSDGTPTYHNHVAAHHNNIKDEVIAIEAYLNARFGVTSHIVVPGSVNATFGGIIYASDGAVGAPAYSFSGDQDLGFYRGNSNQIDVTCGNSKLCDFRSGQLRMASGKIIVADDGTVGSPSIIFASSAGGNDGLYMVASQNIALAINGVKKIEWNATNTRFNSNANPIGAAAFSSGDGTDYWNDISYKTLTDRGCIPWCDDGVELVDGKIVSDLEALCSIKKHPTKKTVTGLPRLDYSTFPKHSYRRIEDQYPDWEVRRDNKGEPWVRRIDGTEVRGEDGVEMTMLFGVMIGAFKEIDGRIRKLEKAA